MESALIVTILKIIELSLPTLIPLAQRLMDHHVDPSSLDWSQCYGRSLDELRAEVDARENPQT